MWGKVQRCKAQFTNKFVHLSSRLSVVACVRIVLWLSSFWIRLWNIHGYLQHVLQFRYIHNIKMIALLNVFMPNEAKVFIIPLDSLVYTPCTCLPEGNWYASYFKTRFRHQMFLCTQCVVNPGNLNKSIYCQSKDVQEYMYSVNSIVTITCIQKHFSINCM